MHIVEDIFRTYFATYSKKATVRRIQEVYGEKAPSIYQIHRILSSETYTGTKFGIAGYCESYISDKSPTPKSSHARQNPTFFLP